MSKTDTGTRLPSVYVTCNAVMSNRSYRPLHPWSEVNPSVQFTLPGYVNAGVNLGTSGFVATTPPADQARFYTMTINARGCYAVSGVGDAGTRCP